MADTTTAALTELGPEKLAGMNAEEIVAALSALGGFGEMHLSRDGFYTKEFEAEVRAQPKFPLMIPTPDSYKGAGPYVVTMQVNGMNVGIEGDKLTMVPQVFWENWQNHILGEAQLRQARRNAGARLRYDTIAQVPFY